jgi:hypothetical protein
MIEVARVKITGTGWQAIEKGIGSKIFRNDARAD